MSDTPSEKRKHSSKHKDKDEKKEDRKTVRRSRRVSGVPSPTPSTSFMNLSARSPAPVTEADVINRRIQDSQNMPVVRPPADLEAEWNSLNAVECKNDPNLEMLFPAYLKMSQRPLRKYANMPGV